ncbi:ATP-dependent dethiobiotin synthetase BioD [Flavitalea flava]
MQPIFITGIGTDIGKTVVAAVLTEALQAGYWKPVQAGYGQGTDSEWIKGTITNPASRIYPEVYKLSLAASPHKAAREEGVDIRLDEISWQYRKLYTAHYHLPEVMPGQPAIPHHGAGPEEFLIIEGAGGLMVPLNDREFVLDLIKELDATVILVSRNYLGSINHSLLTASVCKMHGLRVAGWIFNDDQYPSYEEEIVNWSGIPAIASLPYRKDPGKEFVLEQAIRIRAAALEAIRAVNG